MSVWPFITCHSCRKPVKGAAAVHDRAGAPHHGKCFEIRGLRLRSSRKPLRAARASVGAETCVRKDVSSLSDSPAGSSPAGAFSRAGVSFGTAAPRGASLAKRGSGGRV